MSGCRTCRHSWIDETDACSPTGAISFVITPILAMLLKKMVSCKQTFIENRDFSPLSLFRSLLVVLLSVVSIILKVVCKHIWQLDRVWFIIQIITVYCNIKLMKDKSQLGGLKNTTKTVKNLETQQSLYYCWQLLIGIFRCEPSSICDKLSCMIDLLRLFVKDAVQNTFDPARIRLDCRNRLQHFVYIVLEQKKVSLFHSKKCLSIYWNDIIDICWRKGF